ncbi:hypothetical protein EXS65_00525 [Candidatus Peribacteria bacterium]|nr:hypothetical protein [Candidatus Peribacteria bacterium]
MPEFGKQAGGVENNDAMDMRLEGGRFDIFRTRRLVGEFLQLGELQNQGKQQEAAEKAHMLRLVALDGIVEKYESQIQRLQAVDVHIADLQDEPNPEKRKERAANAKAFLKGDVRKNSEAGFRAILAAETANTNDDAEAEKQIKKAVSLRYWGENVSEEEIDETVVLVMKDRSVYVDYLAVKNLQMIAESDKDGKALFEASSLMWKMGGLTDEEADAEWEKFNENLVHSLGLDRFRILRREQREVRRKTLVIETVEQKQAKAAAVEKIANTLTVARMKDLTGRLNDEQFGILVTLMESGAKDLARALLQSFNLGPSAEGIGVTGKIEGVQVTAVQDGKNIDCSMVHAGKRIRIDTTSAVESFNEARVTVIAEDIHAASLQNPSESRKKLLEGLTMGTAESSFITGEKADYTEGILGSLLKNIGSAAEEQVVMKKLGLITPDGKPNQKMLAWWALEFRLLADQMSPKQLLTATSLQALEMLAKQWKDEKKLSLMSLGQLNKLLTQKPKVASPEVVK